jgi:hemerythrin-like domain-containing protein
MTRDIRLRGLSAEHEEALLIGRRLLQLCCEPEEGLKASWDMILRRFYKDVEPHFRTEEQELFPALETVGEEALVARAWEDHEALRALVTRSDEALRTRMERLGRRLVAHVHFEETELFEVAQRKLPADVLERIARRCPAPPALTTG